MSINLYLNYFEHKDPMRQSEIDECVEDNIRNPFIDKVIILNESNYTFDYPKVVDIPTTKRLQYRDIFEIANKEAKDSINILCNLDIKLPKDLSPLYEKDIKSKFIALSRWDKLNDGTFKHIHADFSQDTWIWKGHLDLLLFDLRYNMGVPGCDNAIVGEFHENGYRVINPSYDFVTQHIHLTGIRDYTNADKVIKKFYFVKPTNDWESSLVYPSH